MTAFKHAGRRPVRLLAAEERNDGQVVVLCPRFGTGRLGRWVSNLAQNPWIRITLDDYGAFVWRLCDGERTVGDIAAALEQQHGDENGDLIPRLAKFLWEMRRIGMIGWGA